MTARAYASPETFKQALERRLRSATKTGGEFARGRQILVFDRFLRRIVAVLGDAATLEGSLALDLRLERARTTKDIDLRLMGSPDRCQASACCPRADLPVPQDPPAAVVGVCAPTDVGDPVRGDGARRPTRLGHAHRRHEGGTVLPRPCARGRSRRELGSRRMVMERTMNITSRPSGAPSRREEY